ncbi:serine hydrolase domain-containing protein [Flavobacterium silvaticum]|uniref:Beta-lactamase family protein n=1 Tax=Flavobacterium silvaticum TaxID=1852020 RepID=A0A972JHG9_9FLAO|nr:serine hydrolase domain-containing protein [Flavobacterium silvaticum]NMH27915.1 beta-lactamase family protein [Flavobacterium silvaticum]
MRKAINRNYLVICLLILTQCSIAQSIEAKFRHKLDSVYKSNPESVGILIHVESPDKNISWSLGVGYADKNSKVATDKDQPALLASNTKTYVAVTILKLIEKKELELNQPIRDLISKKSKALFEKAGYDLQAISIKNLLSHTSGITDYVDDAYFDLVNTNPNHQWTRDEQIERSSRQPKPADGAGKKYHYSDINYLLLTEIIEGKTGEPFYSSIRKIIDFPKLKLESTWFINLENPPAYSKPLAHQYWGKYDWDSYHLNPSWDLFGGGGIVSTTKDLALFFQQLFEGKIINNRELLAKMSRFVLDKESSRYCLGLMNISFKGMTAYYHGGFWGTDVMYVPELNTTISVFTLQKDKRDLNAALSYEILKIIKSEN